MIYDAKRVAAIKIFHHTAQIAISRRYLFVAVTALGNGSYGKRISCSVVNIALGCDILARCKIYLAPGFASLFGNGNIVQAYVVADMCWGYLIDGGYGWFNGFGRLFVNEKIS